MLLRLFAHINRGRRYQFVLLLGLVIASAFAEVLSLGTLVPFLGILTAPEKVFAYPLVAASVRPWGISTPQQLALPITAAFVLAVLVAGGLRVLLAWTTTRLAFAAGADLSLEAYRRTLYQPYHVHVSRNSSEVISASIQKVGSASYVLQSLATLLSSAVLFVAIMLALLAIDAQAAAIAAVTLGLSYAVIARISRRRLARNSERIAREHSKVVQALQEGLGGIRDVLLDGTQTVYADHYRAADRPSRLAQADNVFISQAPRYVMEALGMVLIVLLAYAMSREPGGIGSAIPVLGALALGAQRVLPALQQSYASWTIVAGNHAALADVLAQLDQPVPETSSLVDVAPLSFRETIRFENVSFRYPIDGPWVLEGLDLTIRKGARVGFVGSTGSGKSTALDLLMCLLEPTQGRILVDEAPVTGERVRPWQRTIAHVPQNIYLADASLSANIAFGVPAEQVDLARVRQAARRAQIADFIESQPEGYDTLAGERGIRLSGGQRQRIGIARALYKEAAVLVLDEATSSVDHSTELAIMDAIDSLNRDLTILIIGHRLTTVQRCDAIVQLERGRVFAQGSYEDLIGRHQGFRRLAT